VLQGVNGALKQSHFRGLKRGHAELPGEAGRVWRDALLNVS
jgi:hypothetical protein